MDVKILENEPNKLIIETIGGSATFNNLVRKELWNDKNVSEAAYIKEHPYLSSPKIFIKTSRGLPKTALLKALTRVEKQAVDFREQFKKALK